MGRDLTKVFALLGEKWSLPVLTSLLAGPKRFLGIKESIPGMSQRMLAQTLRHLEADGLIKRVELQTPPRVEYTITKFGTGLFVLLTYFQKWADGGDHDEPKPWPRPNDWVRVKQNGHVGTVVDFNSRTDCAAIEPPDWAGCADFPSEELEPWEPRIDEPVRHWATKVEGTVLRVENGNAWIPGWAAWCAVSSLEPVVK